MDRYTATLKDPPPVAHHAAGFQDEYLTQFRIDLKGSHAPRFHSSLPLQSQDMHPGPSIRPAPHLRVSHVFLTSQRRPHELE
jgi:hypothetical protein